MATSNFQLLSLGLGGADGGIQQSSADSAKTGLTCHILQVTADTVFTTLTGVDRDGSSVNMLTANNLTGITVSAPATISAPDVGQGGYISTITMSGGQILRHTMPDTKRG